MRSFPAGTARLATPDAESTVVVTVSMPGPETVRVTLPKRGKKAGASARARDWAAGPKLTVSVPESAVDMNRLQDAGSKRAARTAERAVDFFITFS